MEINVVLLSVAIVIVLILIMYLRITDQNCENALSSDSTEGFDDVLDADDVELYEKPKEHHLALYISAIAYAQLNENESKLKYKSDLVDPDKWSKVPLGNPKRITDALDAGYIAGTITKYHNIINYDTVINNIKSAETLTDRQKANLVMIFNEARNSADTRDSGINTILLAIGIIKYGGYGNPAFRSVFIVADAISVAILQSLKYDIKIRNVYPNSAIKFGIDTMPLSIVVLEFAQRYIDNPKEATKLSPPAQKATEDGWYARVEQVPESELATALMSIEGI